MTQMRVTRRAVLRTALGIMRIGLLCVMVCFAAFPLYWIIVNAVQNESARFRLPPSYLPISPSLKYLHVLLTGTPILHWLLNSLVVSSCAAALSVVIGSGSAYALARYKRWYVHTSGFVIIITQMIPPVVLMLPLFKLFLDAHATNSLAGVVVADTIFSLPVTTWVMKSVIESIPLELEEAALLDGCNTVGALRHVVLPLAAPGVVAAGMFGFMMSWEEFLFTRTLIHDPSKWVGTIGMASFFGPFDTPWPLVMMGAALLAAPPIVIFMLVQRYFVAGLAGGVKG